ncbi:MAG: patatin-like phospholipase family protein [Candidatus Margulisiibacteriota bacterium]
MITFKKKAAILLLICLTTAGAAYAAQPRIALVLSGGIATRGLSEIGVIKALEEENIPISYVVGTSMGAVLGSLVAQGYTADEIKQIAKSIDWLQAFVQYTDYKNLLFGEKEKYGKYLFRVDLNGLRPIIPDSLVNGQKPALIFSEISIKGLNVRNFDDFPRPFRANATNLETGEEVVLASGYLPKILQASSAVPIMLPPVEIDGRILGDGGIINNLPVNLAEEFKPDFIIAVDLGMELRKKEQLNSIFSILSQNLAFPQRENSAANRKRASVIIEPDIASFTFSDFDKIDAIIEVGYQAARKKIPEIKKLLAKKGFTLSQPDPPSAGPAIKSLAFAGQTVYQEKDLLPLVGSTPESSYTPAKVEADRRVLGNKYFFDGYKLARVTSTFEATSGRLTFSIDEGRIKYVKFTGRKNISDVLMNSLVRSQKLFNIRNVSENVDRIYATGYFESVEFMAVPNGTEYNLLYVLKEKHANSLGVGLRYDTYQQLSLLADFTLNYFKSRNLQQNIQIKLGNEYDFRLTSEFWLENLGQNLVGEAVLFYYLKSQDIYGGGQVISTFYYIPKGVRLGFKANLGFLGQVSAGVEKISVANERVFTLLADENVAKYTLSTKLDFLDDPVFPSNGILAKLTWQTGVKQWGGEYDYTKNLNDLSVYLTLPSEQTFFFIGRGYFSGGDLPLFEYYRAGGEANLIGYGRNKFLNKNLVAGRLGVRFPVATPTTGLIDGVYLSLLQDFACPAADPAQISMDKFYKAYGGEISFTTLLGLNGRASLGIGEMVYLFLSIGNEF